MSKLAIDVLVADEPLAQTVVLKEDTTLVGFKLYMYKHGTLTEGNLVFDLVRDNEVIATVTHPYTFFNDIKNQNGDPALYWHGMIPFEFDEPLVIKKLENQQEIELSINITLEDYTNSSSKFLAWVISEKVWENTNTIPQLSTDPENAIWFFPYKYEIYELDDFND